MALKNDLLKEILRRNLEVRQKIILSTVALILAFGVTVGTGFWEGKGLGKIYAESTINKTLFAVGVFGLSAVYWVTVWSIERAVLRLLPKLPLNKNQVADIVAGLNFQTKWAPVGLALTIYAILMGASYLSA